MIRKKYFLNYFLDNMTKIIGLTGGIGSGKSTVAKAFEKLGVPVYIADDEAKKILNATETLALVKQTFGDEIFDNSKLNRQKLAKVVFENEDKLKQLNSIIHPLVKIHFDKWIKQHKDSKFVIKEAAILFESGSYKDCDEIITVTAPIETRIARVMQRDNVDRNSVLSRMNNQWTDEQKISLSNYIILNIDAENTNNQINKLYIKLTIR